MKTLLKDVLLPRDLAKREEEFGGWRIYGYDQESADEVA